jgi:hypothetical protein
MRKFLERIKYHTIRYKTEIIVGSIIIGTMSILMGVAFPDDPEFIANYVDIITESGLEAIFTSLNTDAPGWLFWISLMMGLYLYYTFAVVGIRIGARAFPTRNEDALELITASNPQSKRKLYLETYLSGLFGLGLTVIVSYFFLTIYSLINDGADLLGRLGLVHLFYYLAAVFVMTIASSASIFRFNKGSGDKYGYLYLVFAFFIDIGSASDEMTESILDLSINHALDPMGGLFSNDWNWDAFITILGIISVLFLTSLWYIQRPDYIEKVSPVKIKQRRSLLPQLSSEGRLAQRFPIFFEELRTDRSIFTIWTGMIFFFIFYIVYLYNDIYGNDPATLAETLQSFDVPIFDAFTHGHALRYDYIGFMGFEYYGIFWAYYALFLVFPSIGASNRDKKKDEQDIIWANEVTPKQVIKSRTVAIQFQMFILFTITYLFLFAMQAGLGIEANTTHQINAYLVGVIYFVGLGILLQGISMLFSIRKGRKYALWFYLGSVIVMITGFLVPELEFVKYLSVLFYYDAVGLAFGEMSLLSGLLRTSAFTVFSAIVYYIGLERYSRSNLS